MGKKKAAARDTGPAQTFSVPSASLPRGGRSGPASNGGSGGGSIFGGGGGIEPGLCVRREKGLGFLSGVTCGVVALALIQLALAPTFPRLLAHWSWFIVTLYGTALVSCRWAKYEETAAYLIFWGLLMVHGLCWLAFALVPIYGVMPGTLWAAYGDHGGAHLAIGSLGSLPLLLVPPLALLLYMWFERDYLVVIYHDFVHAMDGPFVNLIWQLYSPLLLFSIWAVVFRPPLFSDLPVWPGTPVVLGFCMVSNVPILYYAYRSTRQFRGPAHWFSGGVVVYAVGSLLGGGSYY